MRNDKTVHGIRSALIGYQNTTTATKVSWLNGFFDSFVWDIGAPKDGIYKEFEHMTKEEKDQKQKAYNTAFNAGLMLRVAVEDHQKQMPVDKKSRWNDL
jgi:hypothetical protein